MKKTIAILLALVMLLSVLVSCRNEADTYTITANTIQTDEYDRLSELGSRDFEGKVFKVLDANDYPEMHVNYATDETKSASNINEALYNRDLQLAVNYNLGSIEYYPVTKAADGINKLRNQVMANAAEYDMVISTAVGSTAAGASGGTLASIALQGMLRNLNEIEYLSLDKEWWSPLIYKNMLLNNKLFFTTGDIAPSLYQAPAAMYVNMDLFKQYHDDTDIFKIVEDGEWTMDMLYTLTANVSEDTNEDNVMNASEDFFGIILQQNGLTVQNLVIGSGSSFSKVENNTLTMDLSSQTLENTIEKIAALYPTMSFAYGGSGTPSEKQQNVINVTFKGGNALFLAQQLEAAMFHLRDMEGDYAVIPYPKADKDQEQYLSLVNHWCDCFVAVPSSVSNDRIEFVGFMMEAMAAFSNKNLRPFIYETVLKYQRLNDSQSSAMIDVIMDGIVIDYAVVHDIVGLADVSLTAALGGTPMSVSAIINGDKIELTIKDIMKAHGIGQ